MPAFSGCGHFTALGATLAGPTGQAIGIDLRQDIIDFAEKNAQDLCREKGLQMRLAFRVLNCFVPDPTLGKFDRIHVGASCPEGYVSFFARLGSCTNSL